MGKKKIRLSNLLLFYSFIISMFILGTFLGSEIVAAISENQIIHRTDTIVLDPGHGGEDGGAISCTGTPESKYNLEITLRLRDLFELLGYKTTMTRSTDTAIYSRGDTIAQKKASDLMERVKIANKNQNTLFLSIHQNMFQDSKYSGAQVFYSNNSNSKDLAEQLQSVFVNTLNRGSRRMAKQGKGIYVLEKINCPGVLIECGFLSNTAEEAQLSTAAYQKKISSVIATTVIRFLEQA